MHTLGSGNTARVVHQTLAQQGCSSLAGSALCTGLMRTAAPARPRCCRDACLAALSVLYCAIADWVAAPAQQHLCAHKGNQLESCASNSDGGPVLLRGTSICRHGTQVLVRRHHTRMSGRHLLPLKGGAPLQTRSCRHHWGWQREGGGALCGSALLSMQPMDPHDYTHGTCVRCFTITVPAPYLSKVEGV